MKRLSELNVGDVISIEKDQILMSYPRHQFVPAGDYRIAHLAATTSSHELANTFRGYSLVPTNDTTFKFGRQELPRIEGTFCSNQRFKIK